MLHAAVAVLLVEALLRAWRVGDARERLRLRLLALGAPLIWLPILFLLAPGRSNASFAAHRALFAGERWNMVSAGGSGLGDLFLLLAAGLGSALFLRDGLPPLRDLLRGGSARPSPGPWQPAVGAVERLAATQAARLGTRPPGVRLVRANGPVLLCEGVRHPTLVVSASTLSQLSSDELEAAVAHEVAHAMFRDPAWGVALFAVRSLLFFNPAVQWLARAMVDDIERRADQAAARTTGMAEPLARVVAKMFLETHPLPGDSEASFERLFWRIRREGVERRCASLRAGDAAGAGASGRLPMILATLAMLGLTFFIV
jgi:Zn-dependent protease with chaperone function